MCNCKAMDESSNIDAKEKNNIHFTTSSHWQIITTVFIIIMSSITLSMLSFQKSLTGVRPTK